MEERRLGQKYTVDAARCGEMLSHLVIQARSSLPHHATMKIWSGSIYNSHVTHCAFESASSVR